MSEKKTITVATESGTLVIKKHHFSSAPEIGFYPKFMMTARADFAKKIIEKFALIAFKPDGEDATGRQKGDRMNPAEIVTHACDVADLAFSEFEKRGWTNDLPPIEEFDDKETDS